MVDTCSVTYSKIISPSTSINIQLVQVALSVHVPLLPWLRYHVTKVCSIEQDLNECLFKPRTTADNLEALNLSFN